MNIINKTAATSKTATSEPKADKGRMVFNWSVEDVEGRFEIDSESPSGIRSLRTGKPVGHISSRGNGWMTTIGHKAIPVHFIVFLLTRRRKPAKGMTVGHRNGNTLDNLAGNIIERDMLAASNYTDPTKDPKYIGVVFHKGGGKYFGRCSKGGKKYATSLYADRDDALKALNAIRKALGLPTR